MTHDHEALNRLARLRAFAQEVREEVAELARFGVDDPSRARSIDDRAARIAARSRAPLSVAFVGDYSAGKSLLIGALLGTPNLLPVSERPTTGNVTALRLRATECLRPSVQHAAIVLPSARSLKEMVDHLVGELRGAAVALGLERHNPLLPAPGGDADPWRDIDAFGRAVWSRSLASSVAGPLVELAGIRDAVAAGRRLMRSGTSSDEIEATVYPIPLSALGAATRITLDRDLSDTYPEPRGPVEVLDHSAALNEHDVSRLAPVVHRVVIDVDVPATFWGLGGLLGVVPVELLDMPGLNASHGNRDRWLSLRELRQVTTVAIVLAATRPEVKSVAELRVFLEQAREERSTVLDSMVVLANQFDRVEARPQAPTQRRQALKALATTTTRLAGREADPVLVSALVGIGREGLQPPADVEPLSERGIEEREKAWRFVLGSDEGAGEGLDKAIQAYLSRGGLDAAREKLGTHLRRHGLSVQVRELTTSARHLTRDLREWIDVLTVTAPPAADHRTLVELERLREELLGAAYAAREEIDQLRARVDLADPDEPATADRLRDSAVCEVHRWDEWAALFAEARIENSAVVLRVADAGGDGERQGGAQWSAEGWAGTVPSADGARTHDLDDPDDLLDYDGLIVDDDDTAPTTVVVTTDDLVGPWRRTLEAADGHVGALLIEQSERWRTQHTERWSSLYRRLVDSGFLDRVAHHSSKDTKAAQKRARVLEDLFTVTWMDSVTAIALATLPSKPREFPLAPGRALPWHPDADAPVSPASAFFLRRVVLEDVERRVVDAWRGGAEALLDAMRWRLDVAVSAVPGQVVMRRMLGAGSRSDDVGLDLAGGLRRLVHDYADIPDDEGGHP